MPRPRRSVRGVLPARLARRRALGDRAERQRCGGGGHRPGRVRPVAGRFESIDNPDGYLRATIVNLARDQRRAANRRQARELRVVGDGQARTNRCTSPRLLDALARLPYEQRAALVLRYWADWDEATIADALGCRRSTVRSHAKRGLDALRSSRRHRRLGERTMKTTTTNSSGSCGPSSTSSSSPSVPGNPPATAVAGVVR